jgi:hypothetical protein
MVISSLSLKVQKDGTIDGFEPHLKCDDNNTNTSGKSTNTTKNPIAYGESSFIEMGNIIRIDSDFQSEHIVKPNDIFTDDDIKRIINVLHRENDNELIERMLALEQSINEIKVLLLSSSSSLLLKGKQGK